MTTRIYRVQTPRGPKLIRAANQSAAIRHASRSMISAEVASQDDLVRMLGAGEKVEDAGAVMAELPAADPT